VLIAMLLPALSQSRELARRTLCGANLHTVALGLSMYATESNGQYLRRIAFEPATGDPLYYTFYVVRH
jgi:hypothetical protein